MPRQRALWALGGLLASCTPQDGLSPEHPGTSLTFYPAAAGLLRARNTDGTGVRTLAFFPAAGGAREEITMHNEPFVVRRWAGRVITISYHTNSKPLFLPWFRGRHNKPAVLGGHALAYTYEVMTESSTVSTAWVDSLHVDRARGRIGFFHRGRAVGAHPIPRVDFYVDRARVFFPATHVVYEYRPVNPKLIGQCILTLTKGYN